MNEQILLSYGCEGGGSSVYKITVNGEERIRQSSSFVDITEECGDTYGTKEYSTFEAFWNEFVKNDYWVNFSPNFIHDDCKEIISKSVNNRYLKGLSFLAIHSIENWKLLLSKQNAG